MSGFNRYFAGFLGSIRALCSRHGWMFLLGSAFLAASRVFQTVSFFLPLKIFIVISAERVPAYFDFFPGQLSYVEKLVVMACAVPVLYAAYIFMGVLHRWLIDGHHRRVMVDADLPERTGLSKKKVSRLHAHSAKAFAEFVFFVMVIGIALVLNPWIALTVFILVYANLVLFYHTALKAEDADRLTFLGLHRRQFIEYISSTNFLIVFAVLMVDALFVGNNLYYTIFLLLLSRMVFQALNRFSVESLYILRLTR